MPSLPQRVGPKVTSCQSEPVAATGPTRNPCPRPARDTRGSRRIRPIPSAAARRLIGPMQRKAGRAESPRAEGMPSKVLTSRSAVPLGREALSRAKVQSARHRAIPSPGRLPAVRGATVPASKESDTPMADSGTRTYKAAKRYIYAWGGGKAEGNGGMKDLLGGKGAGLAEMTNAGLPTPPASPSRPKPATTTSPPARSSRPDCGTTSWPPSRSSRARPARAWAIPRTRSSFRSAPAPSSRCRA